VHGKGAARAAANPRAMHNRALHDTLAGFVEEAATQLAEEVAAGAEVPFELAEQGRASSPLYCYRPLTSSFISGRVGVLARLESFTAAVRALTALPNLERYLVARGRRPSSRNPRANAEVALTAFLTHVWEDQTDFVFDPDRFALAFGELERAVYEGMALTTVVAPVEGLVIESDEVPLIAGVSLARVAALAEVPADLRGDDHATVAVVSLEDASLEEAGRRLRRLQTALRLWDDVDPAIGPLAWARTGSGGWSIVALPTGLRQSSDDVLLAAEEEDPLRAFCSLVSRRTPRAGELAWALRRFELGCERATPFEGLTDWLVAVQALLGRERWPQRLAAICASAERREALAQRFSELDDVERALVRGHVRLGAEAGDAALELADHLRAVLRDVLCGHVDPDLRRIADELLVAEAAEPATS
jgi:hypothetical protein